jgi:hypothetical protein
MGDVCFILGITPRSGTNFLENQLILHNQCIAPGPIWEDFLVSSTPVLEKLNKRLSSRWDRYWFRNTGICFLSKLRLDIGKGLTEFLLDQTGGVNTRYLVSKTPTVQGLENFCSYFPNSKLLIIVRDGRDVADSGMKSFRWDFVIALLKWKRNARKILRFMDINVNSAFLIKFEDLCIYPESSVSKILSYLELDECGYPFEKLKNLPVSGSSTLRAEKGEINWKATEKKDFQPVARYKSWKPWEKYLSVLIAGNELKKFGYDISENISLAHKVQAFFFLIIWPSLATIRILVHVLKKMLTKFKQPSTSSQRG